MLVNMDKRTAIANGQVVNLTKQEFDLLHVLVSRPGIVFSSRGTALKKCGVAKPTSSHVPWMR